jgi:hypothetical protein
MDATDLLDGIHKGLGSFFQKDDKRIHGWVMEQALEGDRLNRSDILFAKMDENMAYVCGDQLRGGRPSFVPKVIINETKRTLRIHASALTDIRPLFAWRVANPAFADASAALNQLLIVWWVSRFTDLALCDVIKYGLAAGSGDGVLEFDETLPGGGDSVLLPRDPRDTLPIRPSHSTRIQDWGGVVLRQEVDPGKLAAKYPDKMPSILSAASTGGKMGQLFTRFFRHAPMATGTLDGLSRAKSGPQLPASGIQTYNAYFKDQSINKSQNAVLVGPPGANYSYLVQPGKPLYPRGRLVVATENDVFYDGPNPYWHGMFPVARFSPDPWPWSFFGIPITGDMRPLQDGINSATNWLMGNLSQHVRRGSMWDKNTSDALIKSFNPEEPYWKVRYNMQYGEMFKLADVAQVPAWGLPFVQFLFEKFQEIGETSNFQQLLQLRQVPSGETLERYQNALTPGIRLEGRYLEYFLRDLAHMLLCNIFQFYSAKRRYSLVGEAGNVLSDVDWDPDTMIPGMMPGDPGYAPELDVKLSRDERAQFFKGLFTFYVAPNSLLAMNAQEQKLLYLQLYRMGLVDRWTLMEKLEIPNAGTPPPIPLPVPNAQPVPQPVVDPATGIQQVDPATGLPATQMVPPTELRVPVTITEKLMAEQAMGIAAAPSAAGRPPSGEAMPKIEQKAGGRTTVTESK